MFHLAPETLALIVDGPADDAERAHLEACADCRAELAALREQTRALAALTPPPVPDSVWRGVAPRVAHATPLPVRRRFRSGRWLLRAAAALVLFLGGAAVGAAVDREPPSVARNEAATPEEVPAPATDPVRSLRQAENLYAAALARYLAEEAGPAPELDPVRRLAALESIILTARAALDEGPQDAVIAGYYRTALAQREALLSQVQLVDNEVWF